MSFEIVIIALALCLAAYLLGSISSAILICKAMGYPDPRSEGSHNPGATNVMRIAGKGPAAMTLAIDILKGVPAIVAGKYLGMEPVALSLAGLAAFLGHLYPLFFRFQGGKGVATAFGVIFALSWQSGIAAGAVWLAVFAITRISSLSSILAWIVAPVAIWFTSKGYFAGILLMSILMTWRHRQNIRDLASGKERSFSNDGKDAD